MPPKKASTLLEESQEIQKEIKRLQIEGSEVRFHCIDDRTLVELVKKEGKGKNDVLGFLVWDIDHPDNPQRRNILDSYLRSTDGVIVYPPKRAERFLDDMVIPKVKDVEEIGNKIKDFDNNKLDKQIDDFLKKWFVLPEEYILVLRLFIKFSWVQEQSDLKTYLSIWGDRGTGKTRIGTYLGWLCRFPYFNKSGATPAVLARTLDLVRGVAIIDESDMYLGNTEETASFMRIMKGNESTSTYDVVDENRKKKLPMRFFVGFPKVILSAKPIKDDHLSSRCLILELKPVKVPEEMRMDTTIEFRKERMRDAQKIVDELLIFRLSTFFNRNLKKIILSGIEPRYSDIANPLFKLINNAEEHKMFYEFVIRNIKTDLEQRADTHEGQLLTCIKRLFAAGPTELFKDGSPKVYVSEIVSEIKSVYFADVNERDAEKAINNRKIGWALKNLGIKTKKVGSSGKFIDPQSFDLLESLYRRFGIYEEEPEEILTKNEQGSIMEEENKKNE